MANVLMIAPMNAANFDSGNADAGEVLTADGSGGTVFGSAGQHLSRLSDAVEVVSLNQSAAFLGIYIRDGDLNGFPRYSKGGFEIVRAVEEMELRWLIRQPGMAPGTFVVLLSSSGEVASPEMAYWGRDYTVERIVAIPAGQFPVADGEGGVAWQEVEETEGLPPYGAEERGKVLAVVGTFTPTPPFGGSWSDAAEWVDIKSLLETFAPRVPTAFNPIGNALTPVTAAMIDSEYSNIVLANQSMPEGREIFSFFDGYTNKWLLAVRRYAYAGGGWDAVELATRYE